MYISNKGTSNKGLNTMSKIIKELICAFCNKPGHNEGKCFKYKRAMETARKPHLPQKRENNLTFPMLRKLQEK